MHLCSIKTAINTREVAITAPVTFGGITTGQINGAASVTEIGLGQRIETFNVQDVANQQMTLSFSMANSLLTSMTLSVWTANTSDTFGTIVAPTKTQVGATTFTITSTLTPYTYTFTAPTNSINGIEVLFVVGAQTSGTWNIGNVQLELGNSATPIDQRPISSELFMCQRYLETIGINGFLVSGYNPTAAASNNYGHIPMSVTKRVSPTISSLATSRYTGTNANNIFYSTSTNAFAFGIENIAAGYWTYQNMAILTLNAEL